MRTIVLGGATGFIGKAIRKHAIDCGYDVLSVSRNQSKEAITWKDLDKYGLPPCVAVINVAGEKILNPYCRLTPGFKERIYNSRIKTNRKLAEAIKSMEDLPQIFATISGAGYYPPSPSAVYTEENNSAGGNYLSNLCIEWEAAAALPEELNVRQVQVRTGVVFGKNGGFIQEISGMFALGLGIQYGSGHQWMPWIHMDDLCGIFLHAIENESVNGAINGVAPDVIRNKEFIAAYAHAMEKNYLSEPPLIFQEQFSKIIKTVFGADFAPLILDGQNVIPQRILDSGYSFKFPTIDKACQELVS